MDNHDKAPPGPGSWGRDGWQAAAGRSPAKAAGVLLAGGVVLLVALAVSGRLGATTVEAHQVAVKVSFLTGTERVITNPGYQFYIPFLQEIYKFDRTTQEYVMSGRDYVGLNQAPRLTVRANDGSNFWFDELKIQYELIAGDAGKLIHDSGPGHTFKEEWIKAHARSILRDEFGRYSAVEVANPTVYKQAPETARRRLNAILEPHGINVVRIITPNPKFDPKYEDAIETRKEADQEVEELKARVQKLEQVREQRLAAVRKETGVEMQQLTGTLTQLLLSAEQDAIRITKSAEEYAAKRVAEGRALEAQLTAQATGLVQKYTKEAEGIQKRAEALEARGDVVVREALIEKLLGVKFTLVPYSKDPAPERLEHSGSRDESVPAVLGGGQL